MVLNISLDSKKENKYICRTKNNNQGPIAFKGMESVGRLVNGAFAQIQTGEVVGPTVVDIVAMIIPRYLIDNSRSEDAGRETLIREVSGNIINCIIPGFVAAGIGWAIGKVYNPDIKVNTKLPVDCDTLDMLHHSWKNANGHEFWKEGANKKQVVQKYFEHVFNNTEGLIGKEWVSLASKENKEKAKDLAGEMADFVLKGEKVSKKEMKKIKEKFVNILGASETVRVKSSEGKVISTTANRLVDSMHDVCREIHTKFEPDKIDSAIKKVSKVSPRKAAITVSIITGLALAQQAVNRYITKKRTGSDAFVGLSEDNRKQNNAKTSKTKLYIEKALSVCAISGIAAASLANSVKPKEIWKSLKGKNLIKKLEFNSMWPSLNQLRVVYAGMIVGRMLASTGEHELRETNTRDIPGFLNWLVLGSFVSKGVGKLISKGKLINTSNPRKENATTWEKIKHFLGKESLMSHAEIDARKMNVNEAKEILNRARKTISGENAEKIVLEAKKVLKSQLNKSIFAGFAYSALALGLFMPLLNKYITNKLTAKNKTQLQEQPALPENTDTYKSASVPPKERQQTYPTMSGSSSISSINKDVFADFIKTQQKLKNV